MGGRKEQQGKMNPSCPPKESEVGWRVPSHRTYVWPRSTPHCSLPPAGQSLCLQQGTRCLSPDSLPPYFLPFLAPCFEL